MSLRPGAVLGPYQILFAVGAGGMGEVYRARDTRLHRDVAIKVLPEVFTHDPDRLARFTREAQILAALNHSNIAQIYGTADLPAEDASQTALVMELVEGDDLSVLLSRGAIPVADAIPIARQIAEALEAAHEQGIVHRDLKPGNIKVRADGAVKVLDFGLARATDAAAASSLDAMHSPTLTARATQVGVIIGTAAYMAPEQARGRTVDKRADIWAFGVVLYEMLTGRRAFDGEEVSDVLAAVLRHELDWSSLPADVSSPLRTLLQRCLERDPRRRLRDIGEARLLLDDPRALDPTVAAPAAASTSVVTAPARRRALPWIVSALLAAALATALFTWKPWRSAPVPKPRRVLAGIGADASLPIGTGPSAVLSPDGAMLAFVARRQGQTSLFVRKLDQLQAVALAGGEGAESPFFSPDGQWIAFFAAGQLKKISVTGGAAVRLCAAPTGRGGTWADDDTIIFSPSTDARVLMRVPASGGTPVQFGKRREGATAQRWAEALPGRRGVLYSESVSTTSSWDGANLVVAPLDGSAAKIVVRGGYFGRYVPGGYLVYMSQGTLFAVRFDLDRLESRGQPLPVFDGVSSSVTTGGAQIALSDDGTFAYVPGASTTAVNPIDWLTRDGRISTLRAAKADWGNPQFSPDGQKLAVDISDGTQRDIFVYNWTRDTLTQLTFDSSHDRMPVWTPDGRRVVFASDRAKAGVSNIYWVNADGTGEVTRLTDSPNSQSPRSWDPSGRLLAFTSVPPGGSLDVMVLPMEGDDSRGWTPGKPTMFLGTPANEGSPVFSGDGRWIAYNSTEGGGNYEIYVRPFPGPGGQWRISTGGGSFPRWSNATHELLFVNPFDPNPSKLMTVPYTVAGASFQADTPRPWSPLSVQGTGVSNSPFDVHPDGQRVATSAIPDRTGVAQDHVVFIFNFTEYLSALVSARQ